ncbi:MAG: hypothetical protein Q4A83_06550 [Bacillota bacterium]|nr:hypothetical protein [Bacillota bacterium]
MKEYELHISASYLTSGGSKEWTCFTEYRTANSDAEAERIIRAELKSDGYRNITIDTLEA